MLSASTMLLHELDLLSLGHIKLLVIHLFFIVSLLHLAAKKKNVLLLQSGCSLEKLYLRHLYSRTFCQPRGMNCTQVILMMQMAHPESQIKYKEFPLQKY